MDMTRREVLAAGLTLSVACAVPGAAAFARPAAAPALRIFELGLRDRSSMAGAVASDLGCPLTFDRDVSQLWLGELDAGRAADGRVVAGVTSPGALFCLEELLRDRGMRLTALVRLDAGPPEIWGHAAWRAELLQNHAWTRDRSRAIAAAIAAGAPPVAVPGVPADRYRALPRHEAVAWIVAPVAGARRFVGGRA